MTTVQNILDFLWSIAPQALAEKNDNPGFQCGHAAQEVERVLIALDATKAVAQEAAQLGCQLVVTHHPLSFGLSTVTDTDIAGRRMLCYLENKLAVISMHTNLDCARGGVNDVLASRLLMTNTTVLEDGQTAGIVRLGEVPEQPLAAFVQRVKLLLNCPGVRYVDSGKSVHKVAVGGGSCGEFFNLAAQKGCDTFVTADVKYHMFCDAAEVGINLLDAGHFETENPICEQLQGRLQAAFPTLTVLCSKKHADVTKFAD